MSDPFKLLVPASGNTPQGEIRQIKADRTLDAWRNAHVALADLYVCDRSYRVPEPLAEDGKPMTFERRQELMKGKKPMFEASPDGDNSKAKPTFAGYTFIFDDDLTSEPLGESAVNNRPKVIRVIPPTKLKD